jgi:hypothetical protein
MRLGHKAEIPIGIGGNRGLQTSWDSGAIKKKIVLDLGVYVWPNGVLNLSEPNKVRRPRIISPIAHRLDDPAAFHAAIAGLERAHADRGL